MRLNGPQRLLLALSVTWLVMVSLYIYSAYPAFLPNGAAVSLVHNPFWDLVHTKDLAKPWTVEPRVASMAGYVFVPMALLWILAGVARWIAKGFSRGAA